MPFYRCRNFFTLLYRLPTRVFAKNRKSHGGTTADGSRYQLFHGGSSNRTGRPQVPMMGFRCPQRKVSRLCAPNGAVLTKRVRGLVPGASFCHFFFQKEKVEKSFIKNRSPPISLLKATVFPPPNREKVLCPKPQGSPSPCGCERKKGSILRFPKRRK